MLLQSISQRPSRAFVLAPEDEQPGHNGAGVKAASCGLGADFNFFLSAKLTCHVAGKTPCL
jgi:hypothetical protein